MPLLAVEPQIYPDELLDRPADSSADWWVLYTQSRREKQLCRSLTAKEIPFYCPTAAHRYRSPAGRARASYLPLFPSYVFLHGDEMQRYHAVSTGYVCQCLPVSDSEQLLQDLRQIKRLIDLGLPLSSVDRWEAGTLVRVKNGPMEGIEGRILERRNNRLLLVAVNFIQRGATVELGDWQLDEIGSFPQALHRGS